MRADKTSIKYNNQIESISTKLKLNNWSDGFLLLNEMVVRAENDAYFKNIFESWLKSKRTTDIRMCGEGFRNSFKTDLHHFNAVDSLDACIS